MTQETVQLQQRYGELVLLHEDADAPGHFWCVCSCGNQVLMYWRKLKTGQYTSCGYDTPERAATLRSAHHQYHNHLGHGAASRGILFELTVEDVAKIATAPCHYCGAAPQQHTNAGQRFRWVHSTIDRKDSSKSYTADNCVPACLKCNITKRTTPYDEFISAQSAKEV